jgi:hypothetical protein
MRPSLTESDASTVGAILMTHAEMQDQRVTHMMEQMGTLNNAQDVIAAQKDIAMIEADSIDLKRIARKFGDYE